MPTLGGGSDHTDTRWQRPTLGGSDVPAARFQGSNGSPAELGVVEPWLLGCRVLPGRVAGLPGRCRVGVGSVPGCRVPGAAGVLPGCCRVLPGCEDVLMRSLPGAPGWCRVGPGVGKGRYCRCRVRLTTIRFRKPGKATQ